MAVGLKLLLINTDEEYTNGLTYIRQHASNMIDISHFEAGVSDPTISTNPGYIIKDNTVYKVIKTYFDLDTNNRIFIAKKSTDNFDIWPIPNDSMN